MKDANVVGVSGVGAGVNELPAAPLITCEFLLSGEDFLVALNGNCKPSQCLGYSVDANGCIVLYQKVVEVLTVPLPAALIDLLSTVDKVWFVRLANGGVEDQRVLGRYAPSVH